MKITRRLALLVFSSLMASVSRAESLHIAPHAFRFDASHANVTRTERFYVKEEKNWRFSLVFDYAAGEDQGKLNRLHDAQYALFFANTVEWGAPVRATREDFMSRTPRIGCRAIKQAHQLYLNALAEAVTAMMCGGRSEFILHPQNKAGRIPIEIKLIRIDADGLRETVYEGVRETFGWEADANPFIVRDVAGVDIKPQYLYELQLKTLQDSPEFFEVPIWMWIDYRSYTLPSKMTGSEYDQYVGDYCQSRREVRR
ncbi:exported protein of unknown function [Pararobbsia alpina]